MSRLKNDNQEEITDGAEIYRRLLKYVVPYKLAFILAVIGMACAAATDAGLAAMLKPILDGGFVEKDPEWIKLLPLLFIGVALLRGIGTFASTFLMAWIGRHIVKTLRREMFTHVLSLPTSFYDASSSGKLISKFTFDVEQVAEAATDAITIVIRDVLTIIFLLSLMFYTSWQLSLVILLLGPVIVVLVRFVNKRFRRISTRIQASMGNVTQVSEEVIEGHRVIKTFGGQAYESAHFEGVNEGNRRQFMKLIATSASSVQVIQFISACALAGIIYLATLGPMLEAITPGTFMSFLAAMMMLLTPVKRLTTVNVIIQRGIAAAKSLFDLLDAKAEVDNGTMQVERVIGTVEFKDVCFSYEQSKGTVLSNVTFRAEAGESIAFVGKSGSGKTTLSSLLPRFYDYTTGRITIDGHDIQRLTLENLRQQIALVGQDVKLFNDTIGRNIAYGGLKEYSEAEIIHAAKAAHAMEFIETLPEGLNTMVGDNGVLLSGGQRQRLAIARALLKNAPILILDEATSALDTESERYIQAALDELMKDRTTFIIAHRLSTIEKADTIIVMHEGSIVERGKHDQLLAMGGYYANLYHLQYEPATTATQDETAS